MRWAPPNKVVCILRLVMGNANQGAKRKDRTLSQNFVSCWWGVPVCGRACVCVCVHARVPAGVSPVCVGGQVPGCMVKIQRTSPGSWERLTYNWLTICFLRFLWDLCYFSDWIHRNYLDGVTHNCRPPPCKKNSKRTILFDHFHMFKPPNWGCNLDLAWCWSLQPALKHQNADLVCFIIKMEIRLQ